MMTFALAYNITRGDLKRLGAHLPWVGASTHSQALTANLSDHE